MESATDTGISTAPTPSAVTVADSSPSDAVSSADVPVTDISPVDAPSAGPSVVDVPAPAPDLKSSSSLAKKVAGSLVERLRMSNLKEIFKASSLTKKTSPFKKFHRRAYKLAKSLDVIIATASKSKVVGMRIDAQKVVTSLSAFALYDDNETKFDEPVFVPPAEQPSSSSSSPSTPKVIESGCLVYLLLPKSDSNLFEYVFQTAENAQKFGKFCKDLSPLGSDAIVRFCNMFTQDNALEQKSDDPFWETYLSMVASGELEHPRRVSYDDLIK
jgi:hypothetical protein